MTNTTTAPASHGLTLGEHLRLNAARKFPTIFQLYGASSELAQFARIAERTSDPEIRFSVEDLESVLCVELDRRGLGWFLAGNTCEAIDAAIRTVETAVAS